VEAVAATLKSLARGFLWFQPNPLQLSGGSCRYKLCLVVCSPPTLWCAPGTIATGGSGRCWISASPAGTSRRAGSPSLSAWTSTNFEGLPRMPQSMHTRGLISVPPPPSCNNYYRAPYPLNAPSVFFSGARYTYSILLKFPHHCKSSFLSRRCHCSTGSHLHPVNSLPTSLQLLIGSGIYQSRMVHVLLTHVFDNCLRCCTDTRSNA